MTSYDSISTFLEEGIRFFEKTFSLDCYRRGRLANQYRLQCKTYRKHDIMFDYVKIDVLLRWLCAYDEDA